jgi:hypothetical protein
MFCDAKPAAKSGGSKVDFSIYRVRYRCELSLSALLIIDYKGYNASKYKNNHDLSPG